MSRRVLVAGVGMVPFAKPGAAKTYDDMGVGAVSAVLADAGLAYDRIEQVYAGYGGRVVTNPSGGLLSKGHPLGATGLAQTAEITWQLRGEAGARQVEGVTLGLQHNLGLGTAGVVTLFEKVS